MALELERHAISSPLGCFGLELDLADPACQKCPHFYACKTATGYRASHMPITKTTFNLSTLQSTLAQIEPDGNALYQLAHEQVFNRRARDTLQHVAAKTVAQSAKELAVSVEVYIYACLLGHQVSCPERTFKSAFFLGPTAAKRVQFYRDRAVSRFHALDLTSLGSLSGLNLGKLRATFMDSETLFGAWVVGERCRRGGNGIAALYASRECALHPSWLAIEPSYSKWRKTQPEQPYLKSNEMGAPTFNEIGRHRHAISHVNPALWPGLLRLRDEILPVAAANVLHKHQVSPEHILVASPVTNAFAFWLQLGDALLQLRLLQIIHP